MRCWWVKRRLLGGTLSWSHRGVWWALAAAAYCGWNQSLHCTIRNVALSAIPPGETFRKGQI